MLNFLFIKMIPYNCCITKHQLSSLYKDWDQKEKSEKNETFFQNGGIPSEFEIRRRSE